MASSTEAERRGSAVSDLREQLAVLADLHAAEALLGWDRETMMPARGADARGEVTATLDQLAHERLAGAEFADLLARAAQECLERAGLRGTSGEAEAVLALRWGVDAPLVPVGGFDECDRRIECRHEIQGYPPAGPAAADVTSFAAEIMPPGCVACAASAIAATTCGVANEVPLHAAQPVLNSAWLM